MSETLSELNSAKADDVNLEISRQWGLLLNDADTRDLALARGIDLDAIDALGQTPPMLAAPKEEGNRSG